MKKYKIKKYTHFDNRIPIEKVYKDISNPSWIKSHGFYPFIHYELKFFKYSKKERKVKDKLRDIYYASHIDSYIYKYYGDILNDKYNEIANILEIDEVATAYRNNRGGKCNIHFAKEVIDFIKKQEQAYIIVTDFSKYFDNIDHEYLKKKLKDVLNVNRLPDDYFTIYKNITKFSWVERNTIEGILKKKYKTKDKIKVHTKSRYFDSIDFRRLKKSNPDNIQTNTKNFGIPQGAAISSVYSNINLIDFDKTVNEFAKSKNGLYRRYCDDLVLVIPFSGTDTIELDGCIKFLYNAKEQIPNLIINEDKTEKFIYNNNSILDDSGKSSFIDYLGFTFDGYNVKIRDKSLFKFYSRAYKKVKFCNWTSEKYGRKKYRKSLYEKYTHLGKYKGKYGNFLSYVSRAQKIFDEDSTTNNLMEDQVKNHWKYIQERLINPIK